MKRKFFNMLSRQEIQMKLFLHSWSHLTDHSSQAPLKLHRYMIVARVCTDRAAWHRSLSKASQLLNPVFLFLNLRASNRCDFNTCFRFSAGTISILVFTGNFCLVLTAWVCCWKSTFLFSFLLSQFFSFLPCYSTFLPSFLKHYIFFTCVNAYPCVCTCVQEVSKEARRGCPRPWNCSYRLWVVKWLLATELTSSARETSAPLITEPCSSHSTQVEHAQANIHTFPSFIENRYFFLTQYNLITASSPSLYSS